MVSAHYVCVIQYYVYASVPAQSKDLTLFHKPMKLSVLLQTYFNLKSMDDLIPELLEIKASER